MPGISQLYISHANNAIEIHSRTKTIKEISRIRVETQLLKEIHDMKLPTEWKISWSHAILYTTEFDSLWEFAALNYKLPDSCLERLKPDPDLCKFDLPLHYVPTTSSSDDNNDGTHASSPTLPSPAPSTSRPSRRQPANKRKRAVPAQAPIPSSDDPTIDESNPYAKPKHKSFRRPRGAPSPRGRNLPRRNSTPSRANAKQKMIVVPIVEAPVAHRIVPSTLTTENVCGVVEGSEDEDGGEEEYDPATDPMNLEMAARLGGGERRWGRSPSVEMDFEGEGLGQGQGLGEEEGEGKENGEGREKTQREIDDEALFGSSSPSPGEEEGDSGVAGMETLVGSPQDVEMGLRGGGGEEFEGLVGERGDAGFGVEGGRKTMRDQSGFEGEEGDDAAYGVKKRKSALKKGKGGRARRVTRFRV